MHWRSWRKAHAMRALSATALYLGIALILLGVAGMTAFAAVNPVLNESVHNYNAAIFSGAYIPGNATQLTNVKKPRLNFQPNSQLESQPAPGKWIRLCKDGRQCSSADEDIKRRPGFKA